MGSPREAQRAETIKCHKCSVTFNQQDDFICHLLSSHQGTSKSSGHGTLTNEQVVIKNKKYECQFCHELFEERNCYDRHLVIHMKNNMKKVEGSVEVLTVQNSIQPFNSPGNNEIRLGFPYNDASECNLLFHDEQDKVNMNEKTLADKNCDKQNKFCTINDNKGEVTDTAAVSDLNVCLGFEKVLFTADKKGISESSDKTDIQFAINSMEGKKREMASNTSLLAPNARGNMFSDEDIEDRHFTSFTKRMGTDWKDKATGNIQKLVVPILIQGWVMSQLMLSRKIVVKVVQSFLPATNKAVI
ncbi:uncharacterized protein LOC111291669 [Durio zibethinus]|uniref:Uncharacterized protein LOC111291669 n=1 Tax=Durio zibethinus TaxID=66656 RepID=A0A6P5YGA1_DURZI|nr:uncharacterized protein LOC111291669 [Durio zibethinus]XP_022739390.1 uncharacterized protein LOC111291669 [Durio zibethinus]